jgi:hypothetical protein
MKEMYLCRVCVCSFIETNAEGYQKGQSRIVESF